MEKEMIVIVDGCRTGIFYPARFKARGYQCIHVHGIDPSFLNAHFTGHGSFSDYAVDISYTHNNLLVKTLISSVTGTIERIKYLSEIKALPSFYEISLDIAVNDNLAKTVDLFTSPGKVILMHSNVDVTQNDYEKISKWEKDMFVVEEDSAELMLRRLLVLIIINARKHESALE